jgi:hypothetical protein
VSQELQKAAPKEVQPVEESVNLLAVIARAAADPSVDVAKMEALLSMHERLGKSRAEVEFKAALSQIQAIAPRVARDGKIIVKGTLRSTYSTFEAIDKELRPLVAEHGFSYRFTTEQLENKSLIITMTVAHRSGHSETAMMPLPADASDYRSAVQNVRSSITFAKRCLVSDFFNIVTVGEDEDGAGGYISKDQALTIETLIKDKGANPAKVLAFAEADSIGKIPVRKYEQVINALQQWGAKR